VGKELARTRLGIWDESITRHSAVWDRTLLFSNPLRPQQHENAGRGAARTHSRCL